MMRIWRFTEAGRDGPERPPLPELGRGIIHLFVEMGFRAIDSWPLYKGTARLSHLYGILRSVVHSKGKGMRTIKRYSNRKLYDTQEKKYITLEGIADLIRSGADIEVVENDTGEDLTAVTFAQIIYEEQKQKQNHKASSRNFFTDIIRFGEKNNPVELFRRTLAFPFMAFGYVEKEIERRLKELVERGEMSVEQMQRLQKEITARLQDESGKHHASQDISSEEIRELTQKVEALTARLDELVAKSKESP
jgi:polyhydroxyalkanoate synthesis repressor PhaR